MAKSVISKCNKNFQRIWRIQPWERPPKGRLFLWAWRFALLLRYWHGFQYWNSPSYPTIHNSRRACLLPNCVFQVRPSIDAEKRQLPHFGARRFLARIRLWNGFTLSSGFPRIWRLRSESQWMGIRRRPSRYEFRRKGKGMTLSINLIRMNVNSEMLSCLFKNWYLIMYLSRNIDILEPLRQFHSLPRNSTNETLRISCEQMLRV